MNGTYSTTLPAAVDNVSVFAKQMVNDMLNTIQQSHPGAAVLSFTWSQPDVLDQVTYKMEYTGGD